jgi:hypothetical protein
MRPGSASEPLPTRRRRALHAAVLVLGWLAFCAMWAWVLIGPGAPRLLLWLGLASLLLFPAVTLVWVAHNVALYRRLGPRRGLRHVAPHYAQDFVGRRVDADWPALRDARRVTIAVATETLDGDVDGGRGTVLVKRYAAA